MTTLPVQRQGNRLINLEDNRVKILVTGAAGFIGYHVSKLLLARGDEVFGLDNLNPYYSVELKKERLSHLQQHSAFRFHQINLTDRAALSDLFKTHNFQRVVHLAAQAGVRHSIDHPEDYVDSNLVGFLNVLEGCRHFQVEHLVYASSSSVYGANTTLPFSVDDNVDHPVSLYAATKKANELIAHSYSHLYRLPTTGLRFFTVYGPWGRPDMAVFLFTKAILAGEPIKVFNHGQMKRDMTYIDDIAEGVVRCVDRIAQPNLEWSGAAPNPASSRAPYRIYNIGNDQPVLLQDLIQTLEECLGMKAEKILLDMQPGDVPATWANVDSLRAEIGYSPSTSIQTGVQRFVDWYRSYYRS